jgi:hypothetical protein
MIDSCLIPIKTKMMPFMWHAHWVQNDVIQKEANSTGVTTDQKLSKA